MSNLNNVDNTATITMNIKGKTYSIRLDKNQKHLATRAAEYVNKSLDSVKGNFANADREVILTYGIILLADEALELKEEIKKLQAEKAQLENNVKIHAEDEVIRVLEKHTEKVNTLSAMLNKNI